jgi:hypothetical protein
MRCPYCQGEVRLYFSPYLTLVAEEEGWAISQLKAREKRIAELNRSREEKKDAWSRLVNPGPQGQEEDWMGDAPPDPPPGMSVPVGFEAERKKMTSAEKQRACRGRKKGK